MRFLEDDTKVLYVIVIFNSLAIILLGLTLKRIQGE